MTQDEFFSWAETQERRYEFDGGQAVAMTANTNQHGLVAGNILFALRQGLRGRTCQALSSTGGGVATIGRNIRYPDATVTCSPVEGSDRLIPYPVVVFEVVSELDPRIDRYIKMHEYHEVPSIRRYVLVEQTIPVLVSYTREDDKPWTATSFSLGDTLTIPEIGIEISIDDVFDEIEFVSTLSNQDADRRFTDRLALTNDARLL